MAVSSNDSSAGNLVAAGCCDLPRNYQLVLTRVFHNYGASAPTGRPRNNAKGKSCSRSVFVRPLIDGVYFGNLRTGVPSRYFTGDMLFARDKDRRQSHRQWVAVPVLVCHRGSHVEGVSINISEGGIYLFAAANLSPGTQIGLEFRRPDSKQLVRACGTVRRRALYLYGIEFLNDDGASTHDRTSVQTENPVSPIS